jgi:HSP20 family protein
MTRFVDPFQDLHRMMDMFGTPGPRGAVMPMDVFEKDGVYTLRFDLAGADPDKVDVTVEKGMLSIKAERPIEDTEGANWLVRERPTGTHSRQVRLGDQLDPGNVQARYEQGVLTITIPTRPEAKPHRVAIETRIPEAIGA